MIFIHLKSRFKNMPKKASASIKIFSFVETEEGEITESDSSERSDDEDRISKNVLDKLGNYLS